MKKRIVSFFIILSLCVISSFNQSLCVFAEEERPVIGTEGNIDYSYFTELNTLFGYANVPRGVYLATGNSGITKISSYQIGASGRTNAAVRCDVGVVAIVERYNMQTDGWQFITSWKQENTNALSATVSKTLVVDSGYYYRVRSLHYAETDSSSSCTNALYVY